MIRLPTATTSEGAPETIPANSSLAAIPTAPATAPATAASSTDEVDVDLGVARWPGDLPLMRPCPCGWASRWLRSRRRLASRRAGSQRRLCRRSNALLKSRTNARVRSTETSSASRPLAVTVVRPSLVDGGTSGRQCSRKGDCPSVLRGGSGGGYRDTFSGRMDASMGIRHRLPNRRRRRSTKAIGATERSGPQAIICI